MSKKQERFKCNHYTRDIRPHDCPNCRIRQLEANVEELEAVAESWQRDYQRLKDKYEPEIAAVTTDYEEAQRIDHGSLSGPIDDGNEVPSSSIEEKLRRDFFSGTIDGDELDRFLKGKKKKKKKDVTTTTIKALIEAVKAGKR